MPLPERSRLSRSVLWWINGGAAILLVFVFMIMIMTAIAQQEVISRLKSEQLALGYSAALAIRDEGKARQGQLATLGETKNIETGKAQRALSRFRQSERAVDDSWQNLLPFLQRITRAGVCEITLPADAAPARNTALNDYRQCQSAATSRVVVAAQNEADQLAAALQTYRKAYNEHAAAKDAVENLDAEIKARALTPVEQKVSSAFADMDVLLSDWVLFGRALVLFPPALLQILLTFVSGVFGAVLITFVLLVYPTHVLDITRTSETWARILLGGMIALCVYIVLLFAAAVLGTNTGIVAAGTNYMAFCGIGILAGMFSDRAAGWLSEQAKAFFDKSRDESRGRSAPPPAGEK